MGIFSMLGFGSDSEGAEKEDSVSYGLDSSNTAIMNDAEIKRQWPTASAAEADLENFTKAIMQAFPMKMRAKKHVMNLYPGGDGLILWGSVNSKWSQLQQ